jgi:hypothetical protein
MKKNQFYCVKCRDKVQLHDSNITCTTLKNKRPALRGKCSTCKTNMCKFIKASDEQKMKSKFRKSFSTKKSRTKSKKRSRTKSKKKSRTKSKKRSRSRK